MSDKPDPGRELREEKQQMFAEQAKRRERDRPLRDNHQLGFAKALLARLDQVSGATPTRVVLHGPPAGAMDNSTVKTPERIGGCFADLLDDAPTRNEGANEKEIESKAKADDGRAGEDEEGEADTA